MVNLKRQLFTVNHNRGANNMSRHDRLTAGDVYYSRQLLILHLITIKHEIRATDYG
jgi:hypothetical protein